MNVVIPVAGSGKRMRSFGPKALIKLAKDETVLGRQIRLVREKWPKAKIIVVAGFAADKIRRSLPKDVKVVVNRDYETTNVGYSIALGLKQCRQKQPTLIIYGDLVFTVDGITTLETTHSSCILHEPDRDRGVGATVIDGRISRLDYGLPLQWSHMMLLMPKERDLFKELALEPHRRKLFGYEILNEVIAKGGSIHAAVPADLKLAEIDSSKDIAAATLLV